MATAAPSAQSTFYVLIASVVFLLPLLIDLTDVIIKITGDPLHHRSSA
jgi:hypothetical protein